MFGTAVFTSGCIWIANGDQSNVYLWWLLGWLEFEWLHCQWSFFSKCNLVCPVVYSFLNHPTHIGLPFLLTDTYATHPQDHKCRSWPSPPSIMNSSQKWWACCGKGCCKITGLLGAALTNLFCFSTTSCVMAQREWSPQPGNTYMICVLWRTSSTWMNMEKTKGSISGKWVWLNEVSVG